ncbi:fungal-specific transcription factor domain-containing protein [Kalaharituber pfeilii]|nr:fungal-specific transcription factor domain-containing protein [Kalaharituber pfeilii]
MAEPWTSAPEASSTAGQKRNSTAAGSTPSTNFRAVKRRASKACQCCRARKVRCNVVEHGAPCTNCRLDEVECIITESKRRKKLWGAKIDQKKENNAANAEGAKVSTLNAAVVRQDSILISAGTPASPHRMGLDNENLDSGSHVPHFIYQHAQSHLGEDMQELRRPSYAGSNASLPSLTYSSSAPSSTASSYPHTTPHRSQAFELPSFIKPTPSRIPIEDLEFLAKKGALQLPEQHLRHELLKAHFKFVHPFMPLLDRKEFMESTMGLSGVGKLFVDMDLLRAAGYPTRKAARKAFFTKTRLLYDFDYEPDRMSLVQALLLMTYWYETPDDQKDTWHWMGVAISLSHTIGLHRNPENSTALDAKRKKLWKRIWWSCVMRDRLVALGMRRPTRIKSEDCNVPMLTLDDFEIDMDVSNIPLLSEGQDYKQLLQKQRQLAIMCIEKAKLCVCISHVLTAQYSVLNTNQGSLAADGSTRTTMVLLPKGQDKDTCEVERCDAELQGWVDGLPEGARYKPVKYGDGPVDMTLGLHRNLLHMVYFTTVSALHRPQVLPSAPAPWPSRNTNTALQEISRRKVREAANEITRLATELIECNLVRYLPTTGVTVMLPAIIIHLLDIKSSNPSTRERSIEGFTICMQVMQCLRASYASADYATHFLEAAIKKAEIHVANTKRWRQPEQPPQPQAQQQNPACSLTSQRIRRGPSKPSATPFMTNNTIMGPAKILTPPPDHISVGEDGVMNIDNSHIIASNYTMNEANGLFSSSLTGLESNNPYGTTIDTTNAGNNNHSTMDEEATLALKLESFLATTPPPPSSTASAEPEADEEMFDDSGSPDMIFSATTPPPASITIPRGDEDFYPIDNQHSPTGSIDAILGRDIDPFLGHYEEGAELSLRQDGNDAGKFAFNCSWAGFSGEDFLNGDGAGKGFGNGRWIGGGADMANVEKLLDGVDFEDVIQVLETEIN